MTILQSLDTAKTLIEIPNIYLLHTPSRNSYQKHSYTNSKYKPSIYEQIKHKRGCNKQTTACKDGFPSSIHM
ncbi:hypothetical protein Barb4_01174 [Bacteroidales bacterium Barb4]|nr:hypothetical protein Barb4_01174 [Bacteroidales bacterium Barb4]